MNNYADFSDVRVKKSRFRLVVIVAFGTSNICHNGPEPVRMAIIKLTWVESISCYFYMMLLFSGMNYNHTQVFPVVLVVVVAVVVYTRLLESMRQHPATTVKYLKVQLKLGMASKSLEFERGYLETLKVKCLL